MSKIAASITPILSGVLLSLPAAGAAGDRAADFEKSIRPVLMEYCWDCHEPGDSKGDVEFLQATQLKDIHEFRSTWRSVAAQLHNRTMPPPRKPQPSEQDRLRLAGWIDSFLRDTACELGPYAGNVTTRRLNRLEYDHTIRDLAGVELNFSETFPAESGSGEGFNNNGESLFLPPMLMERYLEAAQEIVDAAIVSPPFEKSFSPGEMLPETGAAGSESRLIQGGTEIIALVPIHAAGEYRVAVTVEPPENDRHRLVLKVDDIVAARLRLAPTPEDSKAPVRRETVLKLSRGLHALAVRAPKEGAFSLVRLEVKEKARKPSPEKSKIHQRLLGFAPGEAPKDGRKTAQRILRDFVGKAFRRPLEKGELDPFLALFERAHSRGDAFEDGMKLALKGVLLSPKFLFRIEGDPPGPGIHPIDDHELASRLSYFLWSTMPDAELMRLADEGKLGQPTVLAAQADRMLADPKAKVFAATFIGQWLGTKDVGGRVAPTANSIQHYYTPEVATDMREEAVLLFQHIVREDRSLLELIDADYTFLSGRLAKFYEMDIAEELPKSKFQRISLDGRNRGGVLGMGAVLALTSHFKKTSPVLRGAWVFDTLLGTPVPAPPPDIPPLANDKKKGKKLSMREKLGKHRDHPSCLACHNLIDPIGFGLENFDFLGRWRDEEGGRPVDASGKLPSGESFTGPAELKQVLLGKKEEFLRNLTRKVLGYALGRGLDDRDECTVSQLTEELARNDHRARTLIHGIVLSTPFRNRQLVETAAE